MSDSDESRPMRGWTRVFRREDVAGTPEGEDADEATLEQTAGLSPVSGPRPALPSATDAGDSTLLDVPFAVQRPRPEPIEALEDAGERTMLDTDARSLLDFRDRTEPTPVLRRNTSPEPETDEQLYGVPRRVRPAAQAALPSIRRTPAGDRLIGLPEPEPIPLELPELVPLVPPEEDDRLTNPPVRRAPPALAESESSPELTQIHAAAALGIAPEPAAPAPPEDAAKAPLPPPLERIDFGELELQKQEEVLARYPVEAPGAALAQRIEESAPLVVSVSKLLPLIITLSIFFGVTAVLVVSSIEDAQWRERNAPLAEVPSPSGVELPPDAPREEVAAEPPPAPVLEPEPEPDPDPAPAPAPAPVAPIEAPVEDTAAPLHAGSGSLRFTSRPERVSIEVDGLVVGHTPLVMVAPEGEREYQVRLLASGFVTWQGKIGRDASGGYRIDLASGSPYPTPSKLARDTRGDYELSVELERE